MTILTLCSIMAFAKSNPKVKSALNWLAKQRKGIPDNWNVTAEHELKTDENGGESGK